MTITSKGQTTIPIEMRRQLGIGPKGGKLDISIDEANDRLIISRPPTIEEVRALTKKFMKPGIKPLKDVNGWLAKNHRVDENGYVD